MEEIISYLTECSKTQAHRIVVLDIDNTLLRPPKSNYATTAELFKAMRRGVFVAIPEMLRLYNKIMELGFEIHLVTGRSKDMEAITVENLKNQGFVGWTAIHMKAKTRDNVELFKIETRKQLSKVATIVLNIGDSVTDVTGGYA
jgi:predicted secreted acid phosphatase